MAGTWRKLNNYLSAKFSFGSAANSSVDSYQSSPPRPLPRSSSTAGSSSSRLSRTFSLQPSTSKNICAICLSSLRRGQGHAIFVSECDHPFHFHCIADNIKFGNFACPVCRSRWNNLPVRAPSGNAIDSPANVHGTRLNRVSANVHGTRLNGVSPVNVRRIRQEPECLSNDEVLSITSTRHISPSQKLTIRSFLEYPAVSASESLSELGVLVRVCAPPLNNVHHRVPIDLVIILDVSGSMTSKLGVLKRALGFIIQNLGPLDRLSMVTFSYAAERVLPLQKMSNNGRKAALRVLNSLTSGNETNIVAGLKEGVRVLEERRECNSVASMILLSDGNDTHSRGNNSHAKTNPEYLNQLSASINPSNIPVYTFGLGEDHDSITMHAISDAFGGTFSFIDSVDILQDAFARCIGGLLSVVIQDVTINIQSATRGVQVKYIASGKYKSKIIGSGHEGRINVGDLYAEEEKDFLIYLSVPVFSGVAYGGKLKTTSLIDISSCYKDSTSTSMIEVKGKNVEICRPSVAPCKYFTMSLQVDSHINRMLVIKAIKNARKLAETGDLVKAQLLLTKEKTRLFCSVSAKAGDKVCNRLQSELRETKDRMKSKESYNRIGRAYALSAMSSHSWQRATTRSHSTAFTVPGHEDAGMNDKIDATTSYETPTMTVMVSKSHCLDFADENNFGFFRDLAN